MTVFVDKMPCCPLCGETLTRARYESRFLEILGMRMRRRADTTVAFIPCLHTLSGEAANMWWMSAAATSGVSR
jgi:hypothetical protein